MPPLKQRIDGFENSGRFRLVQNCVRVGDRDQRLEQTHRIQRQFLVLRSASGAGVGGHAHRHTAVRGRQHGGEHAAIRGHAAHHDLLRALNRLDKLRTPLATRNCGQSLKYSTHASFGGSGAT